MSSVNFLRLKNFLGGQGHALELYHTLRDRMFNWKYCDVKDVWKNCPSVGLRFNKHVIPWTGYVFPDLPTSEATKFCLDHMFMHDGVIEGHGLNCSLGDHYRLDGTIVDEGVITIYQTVRGTKNINVLNLVHGLFYLCGYNEFNKKVILMPELNHWGGYCTFKKQMKVDYPKKDLTMFFKIYDNQTIYGIGTDTVGNYTITGNVVQMENEEKIKYEINFVMNYVEGWSVLFEGVLCKDEIQGTWKTSSYSGQFVMKCNPYFNNEIVNKKLKFWNREDPKSRIMNKKEFENLGHPDINFFVNEEKKMEETVLSYLTRVRQMKDSEIDYDIDEACDANCHELKVIPTRAVSKRI